MELTLKWYDEDDDAELFDFEKKRRRALYDDPEHAEFWDLLRHHPRKFRPIACVCGAELRFVYGEYVHWNGGEYTRRCPHLDYAGKL